MSNASIASRVNDGIGKSVAGLFGILVALAADGIQKGETSALIVATRFVNNNLSLGLPPVAWAGAVVLAAVLLVFIFEPESRRAAFYTGLSLLAVLMTLTPAYQPDPAPILPASAYQPGGFEPAPARPLKPRHAGFVLPLPWADRTPVFTVAQEFPITVNIEIRLPAPKSQTEPPVVSARLHDFVSRKTYSIGPGAEITRTDDGFVLKATAALVSTQQRGDLYADLEVLVETEGYVIASAKAPVEDPFSPVYLDVAMAPSALPLFVQRLTYAYRF